jgi:Potassium-transporting ATPase A subunit
MPGDSAVRQLRRNACVAWTRRDPLAVGQRVSTATWPMSRQRSRSTPRSASSRTRAGRTTAASRRWPIHADKRARRPELRLGAGWDGGRDRARAGDRAAAERDYRQLLGRPDARSDAGPSPLSIILALVLVARGAIQTFDGFTEARTLEGPTQSIPGGPFASQEAIKELGTNGGGTLNANSVHPLSNPTPFTNLLEIFALRTPPLARASLCPASVQSARESYGSAGKAACTRRFPRPHRRDPKSRPQGREGVDPSRPAWRTTDA